MKARIYIDQDEIGEALLAVTDEQMGAVGAVLETSSLYFNYQSKIRQQVEERGISNLINFNYRIVLLDGTELKPEGGIGITDVSGIDEIYVEAAGLDRESLEKIL